MKEFFQSLDTNTIILFGFAILSFIIYAVVKIWVEAKLKEKR